ncbi:ATP-binding cassette domain-containing protein [bacterium]|jgi:ABC-type sugar transport system ATPase subunit|nr:ATP-binding cassette domain-containing protein [bacterium]
MRELRFKNVQVSRPGFRLRAPDAVVAPGEWLVISAPSGFGKSSLLRGILGLHPLEGQLWLGERRLDRCKVHERNVGAVFQDPLLLPHLNARENAVLGLRLRGRRDQDKEVRGRVTEAFERLGIRERELAPLSELSGGERQRVALIRALLPGPDLLVLDEPFKGLDSDMILKMRDFIEGFLSERPVPVVWVTHWNEFIPARLQRWVGQGMQHVDRHFEYDSL